MRHALAGFRNDFPGLSLTRCDLSDLGVEEPFREYPRFNLYLIDASDHCSHLTADPACATGVGRVARKRMTETNILLSDPDISAAELDAVSAVLQSAQISGGPVVAEFEAAFADYTGRKHAIAVSSGMLGMLLALKAHGIGPEDEVIASPHSWRETAHAITLAGAAPKFADIDYWAGTLAPDKAEARITPKTRAIIAGNNNGHPAPWNEFRASGEQPRARADRGLNRSYRLGLPGRACGWFWRLLRFRFLAARAAHLRRRRDGGHRR